jgi:ribosomal protein L37AE/L43A
MFSSVCPNCGAPIKFYSAASTTAVCNFCKSTIARSADQLQLIGKQAQLLEDYSRLQVSSEGVFKGRSFSVIGRIQMRYEQGFWNEWYLLFVDGKTGWLSDASEQYAVLESLGQPKNLPSFDSIAPGKAFNLGGKAFTVIDKRSAQCIAAEGELPFPADSRWQARTIDSRSGSELVTLDYSDGEEPTVYRGNTITFDQLEGKRLRDLKDRFSGDSIVAKVNPKQIQALACKSCGNTIRLVPSQTPSIVCPKCKSELRLQEGSLILEVERAEQSKVVTALLPGDFGKVHGFDWTVLGVMQKNVVGDRSSRWEEYLLYNESQGLRWASNSDGAWQWIRVSDNQPEVGTGFATLDGQRFNLMDEYKAETSYVAGAFNWQAKVGEVVGIQEFRAGDKVLASELTDKEQSWSVGQTTNGHDLLVAFGKKKAGAAKATNSADSLDGQHFLITPSIIATGILLLILMPAMFMGGLDSPIEEMLFAAMALWAPLWIAKDAGQSNDDD